MTWEVFLVFQRCVWHLGGLILPGSLSKLCETKTASWTALLCAELWNFSLWNIRVFSAGLCDSESINTAVKGYLNYLRVQVAAEVKPPGLTPPCAPPRWQHTAHRDGNANKGCQDISAQRSLVNDRHLNVVLSLFHKLENNRIGFWSRALFYSLQSSASWCPRH